ncbi:MAG: phosphoribosyltransferase [Candidatus Magasanikbacteria bacterium CG_4_9_14_0_2_um_filter_42_11]|uniref:Orotate phosphoribosyltransferase n=1 Tax=Candidatus Magasanikbacteria bacterium CG_4_9_14_0_2_um_filter_42_11 TaxID=1974643 RepID=A0A2M8F9T2_9BACT|nr:MAG: phosphoribosyltransferase [Candidatus Magasanikbacteria bacterium CG10_big_fil_rev_8_21_14_0_10_43_9]PIY92820.1 MAG: phosphoribosyltransferase [Candidatus Magasanikbacteria bacterium CG_4_10_14_0_8_um_filter_42_12]PJC52495.1 MAG: phosphoribosyltransferase [Candidatus Magasanikbacteria bacterium CG_4_9_14_0_2_um_filter_42_11]
MIDILQTLKDVGAILDHDHFVGTSGLHFDTYINKDALYPHISSVSKVGRAFAEAHKELNIDIVAGPALGGIILSQWTTHHLCELKGKDILSIYAEKKDGDLKLTRGYDKLVSGKNVLVVEDLTSTGGSLTQVIKAVKSCGGNVIAASVMVNKNPNVTSETFGGVPFTPLAQIDITLYDADTCELCEQGIPINTTIGHGKEFLDSKK